MKLFSLIIMFLSTSVFAINPVSKGDKVTIEKFNAVINKVNCPTGTVHSLGFCIEPETTTTRGSISSIGGIRTFCKNKGLRMCSQNELNSAIHDGKVRTYDFNGEGDVWYVSGDRRDNGSSTDFFITVQGNHNQPSHVIDSIEFHDKVNHAYHAYLCCY